MEFSADKNIRLRSLFKQKGWDKKDDEANVYESLVRLLYNINGEEQDLVLDLIERYLWLDNTTYVPQLIALLSDPSFVNDLASFNTIYFFPLINPKDEASTKSGNLLLYHIKSIKSKLPESTQKIKFTIHEDFESISKEKFSLKDDELLVLIDDFLGSGGTLESALSKVFENDSVKKNNTRVIGFVSLTAAADLLEKLGVKYYFLHILLKGISDYYVDNCEQMLDMMKKISKMTKTGKRFRLGYRESEALVTMARTPNNTFPIFWSNHEKNGKKYQAPFPRN